MKLTAKITSIIALLLTLTMVLTGCAALEDILDQILGGTDDPPVNNDPSGYTISAENQDGVLYFSGSVTEGRFDGVYRDTFATLVNLTEVDGGYIIHFVDKEEKTQYIVINDMAAGAALTEDKFEATIFEWNADLETYVVADDSNNRAFGVGKTSTYTTFSCYDVSNTNYNYGKFTPVNNPTIEKGEGGKPTGGNGGNGGNGGSTGGNGGSTDNFGVIDAPVVGTAYKFGMVQGNLDNTIYYLAGGMDGYYMATTVNAAEAIDVYIEEANGGYHLYCMVGGAKTYINFVVSGEHVNGAYEATASTVYRYDAESKTLIAEVDGADYWLATRNDKTYTTMGPCKTSYNGFYGQFYGVGGTTGGNGGNSGSTGGNEGGNQGGNTDSFGVIEAPVVGTAYKFGMVQGNLDNAIYYLAGGMDSYYMATTTDVNDAIDVYLEEAEGGYHLYCMVGGKTYINFVVSGTHVNGAYEVTASTVYRYDTESKTLIAEVDGEDYWLATRNDKTYTTMGPCKTSYNGFYGQFYGVGGTTGGNGGNGGSTGGNEGGNQGGNTGANNPFEGGFELGLVPAYDSSYGGYYIINNNTPYFTADEIADAKAECFEYYAARDNLGRAIMAFACVCNNTRPNDTRGDISSVKPTGWVQKTYDIVPGGALYNRSHLIAWSLTDEDANWENLVTGTEHMNQKVMTQFENQILDYIKASNSNKVLYRVTPIYNGNNLVCTGILLEAYSLNDNGEDISFCVFVYNVQPGISINYANGQSQLGNEAGQNSGLAGSSTGGEVGGTEDTDIPNNTITDNKINITVNTLGIPSQNYDAGKAMFSGTELEFVQIGNYGDGVQMRDKDGNTSILWNNTALPGAIVRIELTYSSTKNVSYSNPDAVIFSFGNSKDDLTYVTKLSTTSGTKTYTITPDGDYTFFKMEHDLGFSFYWDSIVIVLADGTEIPGGTTTPDSGNQGGTTTPTHTCESVCDECGGCTDAACNETACADKCEGHETVEPGTGDAVELETYSHTMAKQDFTANGTATLSGLEWTLAGDGGYWGWDNNNVKGIQLGSKNAPYKTMTLTSASISNVKKIVISTSGASSISGTLTVTVNGVQVGDAIKLTATNTEYTFELDEATTGEIVFTYTQTSSKAFYINTITIYTEK